MNLLNELMKEYQRLVNIRKTFDEWIESNPENSKWNYRGEYVSKARLQRLGLVIRETMLDYEKTVKSWWDA